MLELKNISLFFNKGSANEICALNDISLTVSKGDFITVIGSNGAGKSTMLSTLAGTYQPNSGKIILQEKNITAWPEYKRARYMGRVFQDPLLGSCGSLSIAQNMALALRRTRPKTLKKGVTKKDREFFREKVYSIGLGLENRLDDTMGLLSGGQRQALTLLMATMVRPEILLLDEHTAALDPKTANQTLRLTDHLIAEMQLTSLMVTHNMSQALRFGNRIVMLHQGKIILDKSGEHKKALKVDDLLAQFYAVKGEEFVSDRMLLT